MDTGFGKVRIANWEQFINKVRETTELAFDETSKEYLEAYNSFVESNVGEENWETTKMENITSQLTSLTSA